MTVTLDETSRVTDVRSRLEPVFAQIAHGAAQREADRLIDHEAVTALRDAGYTRLRVPEEFGGIGLAFGETAPFIVGLGEADSNLAQALRAHTIFIEGVLSHPDPEYRSLWLGRIGSGAIVGNAVTEINNAVGASTTVLSTLPNGELRLSGTKFYSTGSLYADWILVAAVDEDGNDLGLAVASIAPGVTMVDDWDGFGQKLTASGTTTFDNVLVDPAEVGPGLDNGGRLATGQAAWQYLHLATLTGIGRAIRRDVSEYVRGRRRSFSHGGAGLPREDPQVLQTVGEVASSVFAAQAAFDAVVPLLGRGLAKDEAGQEITEDESDELYVAVYSAQQVIAKNVLDAATHLFEVGGASATSETKRLDRHWRNARVLANHNPLTYRARYIGDWFVNGTGPGRHYRVGSTA